MKLTTKLLKEMIRKELKETSLRQMLDPSFKKEDYMGSTEYSIAREQMGDYYDGFLGGGDGISEQEVKNVLMNEFGSDRNIPSEEALQLLINHVINGIDATDEF
jgi:hypothetical protein